MTQNVIDEDLVKQCEEKQYKLDPVLVGKDGQVWKIRFFRFFGIFRDVNLYGLPKLHVSDLWIRPQL